MVVLTAKISTIGEIIDLTRKPRKLYRQEFKIDEHTTLVRFRLTNNQKITEWIEPEENGQKEA